MRRRDPDAIVGYVNFPVNRIPSTGEGGLFVRLVVIDQDYKYMPCCGGYQSFQLDETFLGDDLLADVFNKTNLSISKELNLIQKTNLKYFPGLNEDGDNKYSSIPVLAVITIGATGWSGPWRCRFEDLTPEGQKLYRSLEQLYPGCSLRLLTFLDT